MVYIWWGLENYPEKAFAFYDRHASPDRYLFMDGEPITQQEKPLVFNVSGRLADIDCYDCVDANVPFPVVGPRVQALLSKHCPDDFQYLDAEIHCRDGVTEAYKGINITHRVVAIDHNRSEYTYMRVAPDAISRIKHLEFLPNCMGNLQLARNAEFTPHILVADQLRDLIQQQQLTGVRFITADEFNNIRPFATD